VDILDPKARSRLMARVKQRNTKPELLLRRALHRLGFRYRVNDRRLPGSPDLVFPSRRAVIFVNGCFWHDHAGCRFATKPRTRVKFWREKFRENKKRDRRNYAALNDEGWRVLIVWECALKGREFERSVSRTARWLSGTLRRKAPTETAPRSQRQFLTRNSTPSGSSTSRE
jgi:DNA mismatch endonuclease (patch repair protein)